MVDWWCAFGCVAVGLEMFVFGFLYLWGGLGVSADLLWCWLIAVRVLGCSMLMIVLAVFACWVWLDVFAA